MKILRTAMIALWIGCCVIAASRTKWTTRFATPDSTRFLMHAETAPLWSPPPPRPVSELLASCDAMGERRPDAATVTAQVEVWWETVLHELLLLLGLATLVPALLYLRLRGQRHDPTLHLALFGVFGVLGGLLASFAAWLVFGGWGPPTLPLDAGVALGLSIGLVAHLRFLRARRAT
jgi:hypothetical protein